MRIETKKVKELMEKALKIRNIDYNDSKFIIEDLVEAQLEEKFTHGIAKFLLIDSALKERVGKPIVKEEKSNYILVDGNRELGHIAAKYCIELLIGITKQNGFSIVGLTNSSRYGRLKPYGKMIADNGLVGIIMNSAGPSAVTPFNSIEPIFGTNPMCFSFPSKNENIILDFSTSKYAWGKIREAVLGNKPLPKDGFLDSRGAVTINPNDVNSVLPFGGAKGYALNLAIEILAGAFLGTKMGKDVETQYDGGFLFIALNPEIFTDVEHFKDSLESLCVDIRGSKPNDLEGKVYIPGDKSNENLKKSLNEGLMVLDESIYEKLLTMSENLDGGLSSTNILD